jgi:ribosomal protein S18 acetylase RimI-like enzyme
MWRLARPPDEERVIALCLALYAEDPGTRPVLADDVRKTLRALRAEPARGRVVVLDAGGAVLGYAILAAYWSNELGGEVCHLDEIYVAPEARGRGCASELVRALIGDGGPWGSVPAALQLEVTPANTRARSLYERLGFAPVRNANLRLVFARTGEAPEREPSRTAPRS